MYSVLRLEGAVVCALPLFFVGTNASGDIRVGFALNTSFDPADGYRGALITLFVTSVTVLVVFSIAARVMRVPEMQEVLRWGSHGFHRILQRSR